MTKSDIKTIQELSRAELEARYMSLHEQLVKKDQIIEDKENLISWLRRQLFGRKSEKIIESGVSAQMDFDFGEELKKTPLPSKTETVKSYTRKSSNQKRRDLLSCETEKGLRFDSTVPVKTINVPNPEIEGLSEDEYEVISEKVVHKLAQKPASYIVLRYVMPVIKLKATKKVISTKAPSAVIEKSLADVSLLASVLVDKFVYHMPLYRQHQKLERNGVSICRATLTNMVHRSVELLSSVYYALLSSVLSSQVLAMDEVPILATPLGSEKLKKCWFWPIYGDKDEIVFPFSATHSADFIKETLGNFNGVLLSDGYSAYELFAKQVEGLVHALCWAHARRKFFDAKEQEADLCKRVLELIGLLYEVEAEIKTKGLVGQAKLEFRQTHSLETVNTIFSFIKKELGNKLFISSNLFLKASEYALHREKGLRQFLQNPHIQIDTNHLERGLRVVPMGRKNWLFCSTEIGAKYVGHIQSLLSTCLLHGVNPYVYLVDILQRISSHPMRDVHLLTPRLWKENFADSPLISVIDNCYNFTGS